MRIYIHSCFKFAMLQHSEIGVNQFYNILIYHRYLFLFSDVNECRDFPNYCSGGQCRNIPGSYHCTCPSGYLFQERTSECIGVVNSSFCRLSINNRFILYLGWYHLILNLRMVLVDIYVHVRIVIWVVHVQLQTMT